LTLPSHQTAGHWGQAIKKELAPIETAAAGKVWSWSQRSDQGLNSASSLVNWA